MTATLATSAATPVANTVFACIDGLATTPAVLQGAVWAAQRISAPLTVLHAVERPEPLPPVGDYSGVIGMGAQDVLLQRLTQLDEERTKVAQEAARQMLDATRAELASQPLAGLDTLLRQGNLTDILLDVEPTARLLVLGQGFRATAPRKLRLDHRVESVIRSVHQPVLVMPAGSRFTPPAQFVVAYDGSDTARRAVEAVARSPLLRGMPGVLAMAGEPTVEMLEQLHAAQVRLEEAGFEVMSRIVPGLPEEAIPALLQAAPHSLLILGAYGHSRIRQLIVGSTTTALLRLCPVPVLVLR